MLYVHAVNGYPIMVFEIEFAGAVTVVAFVGFRIPVGVPETPPSVFCSATIFEYRFRDQERVQRRFEFSAFLAFQRLCVLDELSAVDSVGGC